MMNPFEVVRSYLDGFKDVKTRQTFWRGIQMIIGSCVLLTVIGSSADPFPNLAWIARPAFLIFGIVGVVAIAHAHLRGRK